MNFQYTLASPLCKVFPNGQNLSPLKEPRLTGLRGETVSFQIAYLWNEWGREYGQMEVVPPCQGQVRVRTVELVPSQYPCHQRRDPYYLAAEPGLYPDLLRDLGPQGFPLITGQWRCLWVDVALDGPAGAFPVELRLRAREEELALVKLTCEVLDMDLPRLPIPHTEWFHSDCLANYYGVEVFSERWWELVEAFVRTAAQRHCNMLLTPVFTPPLDTAPGGERRTVQLVDVEDQGGTYRFGFEKFRRWIRLARDCGMEYIEISHLFSQWGAKAAPKIMGTKEGRYQQLFGWNTQAAGPEYGEFLHQFLTALKPELEALDEIHLGIHSSSSSSDGSSSGTNILEHGWDDWIFLSGGGGGLSGDELGTYGLPSAYAVDLYLNGEFAAELTLLPEEGGEWIER